MLDNLYEIFGDKLPERHVFFATEGAPTRAPLFNEFGSWLEFCNAYARFVAVKNAPTKLEAPAKSEAPAKEVKNVK